MDSVKIEGFLALAEHLNYTRAAEAIGKSQSVLSRQIAALEEELGVILVTRSTKEVALTEAGRIVRKWMEQLRLQYAAMKKEALAAHEGRTGVVSIGVLAGLGLNYRCSEIIKKFAKEHPDIQVKLTTFNQLGINKSLVNDQLDFVVCAVDEYRRHNEFRIRIVNKVKNCVLVSKDHPLANVPDDMLSLQDFKEDTWFVGDTNSFVQNRLLRYFENAGITPTVVYVENITSQTLQVQTGHGVTVTCADHAYDHNSLFKLKRLKDLGDLEEGFICKKTNENPCAAIFDAYVKECVDKKKE